MYRPSVQAVPGAKVRRYRLAAPMARYAVRSVQDALNAGNAVSRLRSSRPNAVSARAGRCPRRPFLRLPCPNLLSSPWTAAVHGSSVVPTTRHGG
ncbi:hypothetical protein [Amycolatopsis regifaucium]|uniref:Uncharacterized protein n=1 Tax=Amycolatopsis regifaucium TaxID=546365 RepID=A0A154MLP4_9PSEU|nr:hypothetical protein [Amycolatopsis regifaucium]KZB84903.1 hypothetical protein AVL48_01460 [Amycolatopsis regifaucium]OKA03921.1 hypothetical protein ATP06_0232315 [Amycolatopsis regifaucium]SFI00592.1 hypothetical protein SAMN04489731_107401 [Amycolatopsis regifaucium]